MTCSRCGWTGDPLPRPVSSNGARYTKRMLAVQGQHCPGKPLDAYIAELLMEGGHRHVADTLGIAVGSVHYWTIRLGINVRRVAVMRGETVEIVKVKE